MSAIALFLFGKASIIGLITTSTSPAPTLYRKEDIITAGNIGITVGRTLWLCAVDVLALGKTPKEVTLTITENDTISDIAKKLGTFGYLTAL